jgi:hypothetical protein
MRETRSLPVLSTLRLLGHETRPLSLSKSMSRTTLLVCHSVVQSPLRLAMAYVRVLSQTAPQIGFKSYTVLSPA